MKKIFSNSDVILYDAAPGPAILLLLGIPLAIVIVVVIIVIIAILLIRKARKNNRPK